MSYKKIKIGIVGVGTIGSRLAKTIVKDFKIQAQLIGICDIDKNKIKNLQKILKNKIPILPLENLIKKSDLIIESASAKISHQVVKKAILNNKDVMIMSVGGLLGDNDLFSLAKKHNIKIYIPSGAISGIDAIKAANLVKINKVTLTTRKPPKSLIGAPYILKRKINLDKIKKETVLFDGNALNAAKGFPGNINVAAILSLAGIGPEKTKVKIVTSPKYTKNIHEIEIISSAGIIKTQTQNLACPDNPKTSYLAVLSAIATLKQILEPVKIGT